MKNPMKFNRIPVAAHGLHKHPFNFPTLTTGNFFDVIPMWYQPLHKGESVRVQSSLFARTQPTVVPSLVTGRINYKAIFVPYRFVWKPYYECDQGTPYINSNGVATKYLDYIYVSNDVLSNAFVSDTLLCSPWTSGPSDITTVTGTIPPVTAAYVLTDAGHRVLRILDMLGCRPNFDLDDTTPIKALTLLCFVRAFIDYYFPKQYVGSTVYNIAKRLVDSDLVNINAADCQRLFTVLFAFSNAFYDESIYDLAWDSPVAPNTFSVDNPVSVTDVSNDSSRPMVVGNDNSVVGSPATTSYRTSNGTPYIGGNINTTLSTSSAGVVTQYVLDALQSINNYVKRHQLAGGHLLDRFLASRGQKLDNTVTNKSYFVGQYDYELQISAVENNSDTNLGELAGKGVISSNDRPLSFDFKDVDDDGIALVVAVIYPDCDIPCSIDPFNLYVHQLDSYHAEFDKLGVEVVPNKCVYQTLAGIYNRNNYSQAFGFLPRYYGYIAPKARLSGDFVVNSRGALSLSSYHTFRDVDLHNNRPVVHSYSFVVGDDSDQYQRLFYASKQDNIIIYNRWFGEALMQKLPLGDSYDWDDDEFNKKVTLMTGGNV